MSRVREGEPSRTAFGAAVLRAVHPELDPPGVFEDPLAWPILGDRDKLLEARAWPRSRCGSSGGPAPVRRGRVAAAVARGCRQAVVLGARLDTFAYRHPHPGLRVCEVDFPATGDWKRERLADAGIDVPASVTYVGVDFEREAFLDRLVASGLDVAHPTFFLWLGVVPYLSREATEATLRSVASIPGGEVVFDVPPPAGQVPLEARADRADLEARVAELGEPFRGAGTSPRWRHCLSSSASTTSRTSAAPRSAPATSGWARTTGRWRARGACAYQPHRPR